MSTWAVSAAPAGRPGRSRAANRSSRLISAPDGGRRLDRAPNVTATSPAALSCVTWYRGSPPVTQPGSGTAGGAGMPAGATS
jgi:hypothetical protein